MRVVSGIQPTGNLHLGNYLGAIRNWVKMQDEMECLYFLADLHAISMPVVPEELTANTREMAAALLACGLDTNKAILFNQARVPAHAELQWQHFRWFYFLNLAMVFIVWRSRCSVSDILDQVGANRGGFCDRHYRLLLIKVGR